MIKHNYPGKFIVIEGLDGSGKSSQVKLLIYFLKKVGKKVVVTKEPTIDSESGKKIRQVLRGEIIIDDPLELQNLYVQDRKEHLENKVIPAIKLGDYMVSSRYAFSTFAYGYSDGLSVEKLIDLNKEFLLPDVTIVIDVMPEHCIKRIEERGEAKEYFEQIDRLTKVNEIYKKLPKMFENVVMVNGEKPVKEVFKEIEKIVRNIL